MAIDLIDEEDPTEPYQELLVELEVDYDADDLEACSWINGDEQLVDENDWAALVLRANSAPPLRPPAAEGPDALMGPPILLTISADPRPGDEVPKLNEVIEHTLRRMGERRRRAG